MSQTETWFFNCNDNDYENKNALNLFGTEFKFKSVNFCHYFFAIAT